MGIQPCAVVVSSWALYLLLEYTASSSGFFDALLSPWIRAVDLSYVSVFLPGRTPCW